MEEIRILHIVSSISIGNGIMGVIMNYYRNINLQKFIFDFLYFQDSEKTYEKEIKELGGKIYKLNQPSLKNILQYGKYVTSYLKNQSFEYPIVHTHELALITFLNRSLRENGTKHIISHSHSVSYSYHPMKAVRNYIISRPLKRIANSFLSCSEASAKFWYGEHYLKENQVKIIKNAIDCEKYIFNEKSRNEVRKILNLQGKFVVGHVGRFAREKNHKYLVDVFNELLKIKPNSLLMLIGDGENKKDIERNISDLGISNKVLFLGQRNDVHKLYQAMDVFVFPSLSEGLGATVIEAQASGLLCFVSDTITREVNICNTKFLTLKSHPAHWAYEINKEPYLRDNSLSSIKTNGYCIKSEVINLEKYYERLIENCGQDEN